VELKPYVIFIFELKYIVIILISLRVVLPRVLGSVRGQMLKNISSREMEKDREAQTMANNKLCNY
jgi:hypothetical protein